MRICLVSTSFNGPRDLSECRLTPLLKCYGGLYAPTPILGYTLKIMMTNPKMFVVNSYSHENKLEPLVR